MKKEVHTIEGGRKLYLYSFGSERVLPKQRNFWSTVGEAWRGEPAVIEEWNEPVTKAINERIGNHAARVLDLGCGARSMPLPSLWRVFGTDPVGEMLAGNRSVHGNPHALPFQDAMFDAVVSRFAVMLDPNPAAALREARRLLRAGGTLTISVWDGADKNQWASAAEATLRDVLGIRSPGPGDPTAYCLADPSAVSGILADAGLQPLGCDKVDVPYFAGLSAEDTFRFLLKFIGPIRSMFERVPEVDKPQVTVRVVAALSEANRNGSAWVHHAVRELKLA